MSDNVQKVSGNSISIGNHPIAHCPEHGFFDLPWFRIEGIVLDLSGIKTNCPICNRVFNFIPGIYAPKENGYDLILSNDTPKEVLQSLIEIAQRLERAEISIEQAVEQVSTLSPKLTDYLYPPRWSEGMRVAIATALLSAVLSQCNSAQPTTVNNIQQTIVLSVETSEIPAPDFEVPIPTSRPPKT